jgi:iron(III) transport system permease protein
MLDRMSRLAGRLSLAVILGGVIAMPLLLPYWSVVREPAAMVVWREGGRIADLFGHTAGLIAIVLILVMPVGVATAFLLHAGSPRLSNTARMLFVIGLATPLPITTVAWHVVRLGQWSPFAQGLFPAALLHALAGLPWVILIVDAGMSSCDPALDDDARLHVGPFTRALQVTLPNVRGFVVLAALWVAAQTASEIVITDMLQVRTFAEEVYTQAVAPATESSTAAETAVARAVAATMPLPLILIVVVLFTVKRFRRRPFQFMQFNSDVAAKSRWAGVFVLAVAVAATTVPVANLVIRSGASIAGLSVRQAVQSFATAAQENVWLLLNSVIAAAIVGVSLSIIAGIAVGCVLRRPWSQAALLLLTAFALAVPGPIIGLGVRSAIDELLFREQRLGINWLRGPLYDGPSMIPAAWTWMIRAWPLAIAIWWPAIARLPRDFGEATRMDTGNWLVLLRHDVIPALWRPSLTAAGLVAVYSLGEVSASHLVATPGGQSFAHDVFTRMHYGITPELAGMCLVLLIVISVVAVALPRLMRPLVAR